MTQSEGQGCSSQAEVFDSSVHVAPPYFGLVIMERVLVRTPEPQLREQTVDHALQSETTQSTGHLWALQMRCAVCDTHGRPPYFAF
jgi:hypothetical protein